MILEKAWDYQLDFVRLIAAFFVVVVHTVAAGIQDSDFAYYSDLIASSGIFMFLLLSGATNVLPYRRVRRGPSYGRLLKPTFFKLVLPYLFWTLVFTGVNGYLKQKPLLDLTNWALLGKYLWNGGAWYHLYFMVLLIYLYLVFGLFYDGLKRFKPLLLVIFGLTPIGVTYLVNQVHLPDALSSFLYLSPFNWWGILFLVGMLWGLHFKAVTWFKHKGLQLVILGVTVGYFALYVAVQTIFDRTQSTAWYTGMMYLRGIYAFLSVLIFYGLGYYILRHFTKLKPVVKHLGRHVYTLYFCHPLIICILDQLQQKQQLFHNLDGTNLVLVRLGIVLVGSIVLTAVIDGVKDGVQFLVTQKRNVAVAEEAD